jgi:hypothetical protein
MIATGYPVTWLLEQSLPILPAVQVGVGNTWRTEQSLNTLIGWSWAFTELSSVHTVKDITRENGITLIHVATESVGWLQAIEGENNFEAFDQLKASNQLKAADQLTQSAEWIFDATNGRLISLNLEQNAAGKTAIPQGMMPVKQVTTIVLSREDT